MNKMADWIDISEHLKIKKEFFGYGQIYPDMH